VEFYVINLKNRGKNFIIISTLTKMQRNEAKRNRFSTQHWRACIYYWLYLVDLKASLLDVVEVRFVFVLFVCELSYLVSKLCSFAKLKCLYLLSSKLTSCMFLGRLVGSFFTFCFVLFWLCTFLSCQCDLLQHSDFKIFVFLLSIRK